MNFNIVIGNPPYQVIDGGAGASATPIYNLFIELSQKVSTGLVSIISPARWMIGGKGLDDFRMKMLNDKHFMRLINFTNSFDVFDGVDIMGGISFFTWDKLLEKKCHIITHNGNGQIENTERFLSEDGFNTFVKTAMCIEIYNKIKDKGTESFSQLVSKRMPYGLRTDFFKDPKKYGLPNISESPINDGYSILGLLNGKRVLRYIPADYPIPKGKSEIGKWKIFIPYAYGCGQLGEQIPTPVIGKPAIGLPGQICTETFLRIGCFVSEIDAQHCMKYMTSKFFRLLVGIKKNTQHTSASSYELIPMQDFTENSDIDWAKTVNEIDEQLSRKYDLTKEQIEYINKYIADAIT